MSNKQLGMGRFVSYQPGTKYQQYKAAACATRSRNTTGGASAQRFGL